MGSLSKTRLPWNAQLEQETLGRGFRMRYCYLLAVATTIACSSALAQTPLSAYVDSNGFIDVQKLTCAQLAGTYQEDANSLASWYSGWYNGLAKKHYMDLRKGKVVEHEVIQYCKANPDKLIIEAIAVVFKDERAKLGIRMKAD